MYLVYNKQVKDVCLRSKGIQAMAEQDRENCEARADMEDKKGKYKWLIILAACAAAAVLVTGVCLYWGGKDASRGKQHEIKAAENETEISEGTEQKWTEDEIAADIADNAFLEEKFFECYQGDYEKECELFDGGVRYRMVVLDAAAGSRWYGLLKSEDRGLSWDMVSDSPFGGDMGMGIDFTFLDEELGFATLSHNGGDEADLYVTENGGESYQRAVIQGLEVTLEDGYLYNPYDFPQMPYEEDGKLYVLCGQGNDGDYDGGDAAGMALYESTDGGHTFSYKEIRKGEEK